MLRSRKRLITGVRPTGGLTSGEGGGLQLGNYLWRNC